MKKFLLLIALALFLSSAFAAIPTSPNPGDLATDVAVTTGFSWVLGEFTTGCKISLGTNNPPTNLLLDSDLEDATTYLPPVSLDYNTAYFWQITAYRTSYSTPSPIWSFTTQDYYEDGATDLPTNGDPISPSLVIPNVTGVYNPVITFSWNPSSAIIPMIPPNVGLAIQLTGEVFAGRTISINPDLGYNPAQIGYRTLPTMTWTMIDQQPGWTATDVTFTLPGGKADGDVDIIFPDSEEGTLPVTLSAFTAILASDCNSVMLNWTVESETNHAGYNVLRNTETALNTAICINSSLITNGNHVGSQINYSHTDTELEAGITYHYWLQSMDLSGESDYYGPLTVLVTGDPENPETPDIPLNTMLMDAFPNPFNPNTTLRYSLKEAGKVKIDIYNVRGQLVRSFENSYSSPGYYQIAWDGRDSTGLTTGSGMYFYRMRTNNFSSTKKMIMTK